MSLEIGQSVFLDGNTLITYPFRLPSIVADLPGHQGHAATALYLTSIPIPLASKTVTVTWETIPFDATKYLRKPRYVLLPVIL